VTLRTVRRRLGPRALAGIAWRAGPLLTSGAIGAMAVATAGPDRAGPLRPGGERGAGCCSERRTWGPRCSCCTPPAPTALRDGIVLEHVSFRYAGGAADALSDVSLRLPAGSVVAIVGENGAGKTTLVKLIANDGLYAELFRLQAAAYR
jgi:ABC-type multidrug transport system fused ATPase/permease subunit